MSCDELGCVRGRGRGYEFLEMPELKPRSGFKNYRRYLMRIEQADRVGVAFSNMYEDTQSTIAPLRPSLLELDTR